MATNNPLLVPVNVAAFVINENVLANKGVNIMRWQFSYSALNTFDSPQPQPFAAGNNLPGTGVIVDWELPAALRRGVQQPGGLVQFPLVPNRWLVVRYSGPAVARIATAWVVESDTLGNNNPITGGSPYIAPFTETVSPTWVGQVVSLDNFSAEPPPLMFLTAVAPGNNLFTSFQPYCNNVFSIFDPLTGVAEQDTLSYFVAGWYTDQDLDFIGTWQQDNITFEEFLRNANWQLAAPSTDTCTWGLYHGMVWGIDWDLKGPAPNNVPDPTTIQVAVGNTATDALTALIKKQSIDNPLIDAELLEALQYGLLPFFDQPDAQFQLSQKIEEAWFTSFSGGYAWEVVNTPVDPSQGDPPPPLPPAELELEAEWLATLNQLQSDYDNAVRDLAATQWSLYQVWWKFQFALTNNLTNPYPSGTSQLQFEQALNPQSGTSLVSQAHNQLQAIDELKETIDGFILSHELPSTRQLKQFARRPFAQPYDPVVLMQGLRTDTSPAPTLPRVCRFLSQVVTGFFYGPGGGGISLPDVVSVIPVPQNMSAVPSEMLNLLQEFFMLDASNATMVSIKVMGTTNPVVVQSIYNAMLEGEHVSLGIRPDLNLAEWTQPWSPLVLLWDVLWYPIDHNAGSDPLWDFDGDDYVWSGEGFSNTAPVWDYTGMTFMTPQASFNFRAQVERFIRENPGEESVRDLNDFITTIDNWDFLSQGLTGFSQALLLRDPSPNASPGLDTELFFGDQTLSTLVGSNATAVPEPGVPQQPPFGWPPSGFQNWRAGQFSIRRLYVVDRFGQTCELVNPEQPNFRPVISDSLLANPPVFPNEQDSLIQLPPRVLQPARLNFDFVSCLDDHNVLGLYPGVNPVCAWLLHNFLDKSVMTYDNTGVILGAIRVVENDLHQEVVVWQPAPESPYITIEDLINEPHLKHLGQCLSAVQELGSDAFASFLDALDEASWTIDSTVATSDIGLALLAGRPIAMVRVQLELELDATVVSDPSWRFTFQPEPNPMTGWAFNVRLGEAAQFEDGLIGYFSGDDYDTLFVAQVPTEPVSSYIVPIGKGDSLSLSFGGGPSWFTLLMDPRSPVHATTGILPNVTLTIPHTFVNAAFNRLQVLFHAGPVLTTTIVQADTIPSPISSVVIPTPFLKNGIWLWQQFNSTTNTWETSTVAPPVQTALLGNAPVSLRSGLLRLINPRGGPE